jgi:hypothetical protein
MATISTNVQQKLNFILQKAKQENSLQKVAPQQAWNPRRPPDVPLLSV